MKEEDSLVKVEQHLAAGLVAHNIVRKQQRMSIIAKVTGLALGAIITGIASRRQKES